MRLDRLGRLLSGYAAGTLSDEERRLLFEAALEDQAVFNALAREQSLKELLDDPAARQVLLDALQNFEPSLRQRMLSWVLGPRVWAAAGCGAAVVLAVALLLSERPEPPRQIALRREAPAPAVEVKAPERGAAPAVTESPARRGAERQTIAAAESSRAAAREELRSTAELSPGRRGAPAPAAAAVGERSRMASPAVLPLPAAPPPAALVATPVPPRTAEQTAPPEALGVTLYRRAPEGEEVPISLDTVLHAGDGIRVSVLAPADGILTVILEEGGVRRPLFRGAVRKGERRLIPEGGPVVVGSEPGDRRLVLVLGSPELSPQAGGVKVLSATDVSLPITVEIPLRYRFEP
ncbi:MAG TPA: hypothetical protein VNJ11_05290 [Bryobacteraceae bacterium]|nr:hypothetical protein [Bryobacteraceae bacterium]